MNRHFFENILPGTLLFSRFVLIRCISAGENGGVYLVQDAHQNGRRVAIKVLSAHARIDDSISGNLFRELTLSRCVDHPNVLRGEEFFRDDDFAAFTMEFMDGGSLADRLEGKKPVVINRVTKILSQLCDGLQAIHEAGIVHRDLKPENVLLSAADSVKIADFGISTSTEASSVDAAQSITGSLNYLSPEYIASGDYDIRSDIYAVGVIAYELTTGRLPFGQGNLLDTLLERVRFDPTPPHMAGTHVPRPLSNAILKAMHRNPENRFQSLEELRSAVDFIKLPNGLPLWTMNGALQS